MTATGTDAAAAAHGNARRTAARTAAAGIATFAPDREVVSGKVVVVVLNWNNTDDTVACVRSLMAIRERHSGLAHGKAPDLVLDVVVVDNGSATSPLDVLREQGFGVPVVETGVNLGYAGGNNAGIRWALERGAEFVWILNNDAEAEGDALAPLVECARRHPAGGAFSSKVLRGDDPKTIWVAWGTVTWRQSLVALAGENAPDGPAFDEEREIEWAPGCSLLLRAAAVEDVGGFDEEFFAYHEDVDWAARARAAGWTLHYVPASRIVHHIHGSSGGASHYGGFRKYLSARNTVLYARRHASAGQAVVLALSILVTFPFQLVRRALTGEAAGVWIKLRGWRDALLGRPIPFEELGLR